SEDSIEAIDETLKKKEAKVRLQTSQGGNTRWRSRSTCGSSTIDGPGRPRREMTHNGHSTGSTLDTLCGLNDHVRRALGHRHGRRSVAAEPWPWTVRGGIPRE